MAKIIDIRDVLEHELKDIYSAENQLLKTLPRLAKKAASPELRDAFLMHAEETENQIGRLETIADTLEISLKGKVCKAMKGLVEEAKEILKERSDNPGLVDLLLIGAAQKVEHYEISAYGTARTVAEQLGLESVAQALEENLEEESETDERLTAIAQRVMVNVISADDSEESDEDAGEGSEENEGDATSRSKEQGVSR